MTLKLYLENFLIVIFIFKISFANSVCFASALELQNR